MTRTYRSVPCGQILELNPDGRCGGVRVVECAAMYSYPLEETRPNRRMIPPAEATQPHRVRPARRRSASVLAGIWIGLLLSVYFFAPIRTNILVLGIDRAPEGTFAGRSDTMVLSTVHPLTPYVGMLSIPRDLWVEVPGVGANRINTAHYFAEVAASGSGPQAAKAVIQHNFGVRAHYTVRIQFQALTEVVDALDGIEIELAEPMSGYPAGRHLLAGEQALAFVRDRAGSDDFARMARGQLFLRAFLARLANPLVWPRLPAAAAAAFSAVETDVPLWQWPRLSLALLRVGPSGIDGRVIGRDMAVGFTTDQGAQVLASDWPAIQVLVREMFGQ